MVIFDILIFIVGVPVIVLFVLQCYKMVRYAGLDPAKAAPQPDRSCTLCQCGESKEQSDLK